MKNFFVMCLVLFSIIGCGSGSNTSSAAPTPVIGGIGDSNGNDSAYTLVVGVPYAGNGQTGGAFYNGLLTNLTAGQSKVPVSRIMLSVQNPYVNPNLFAIGDTVGGSGLAVQFLSTLAQTSSQSIQVYVFADVETSSLWESWVPPVANPSINSCNNATKPSNTQQQQDVLKSICWASLVNQLITKESGAPIAINGISYDGQSFILGQSESTISWVHDQTSGDNLLLGWISGGFKSYVDLNLIEVYNIGSYNHSPVRVDEIEPQKVVEFFSSGSIATPVCSGQYCSYTGIFPGVQWATNVSGSVGLGAVGANIYQCAISQTADELATNSCDKFYTSVIDTTASPESQIMQSLNYIYSDAQPIYGVPPKPQEPNSAVVYLFSTEYIGPMKSYYGSNLQCAEKSGNCSCIASLYNPTASCGDGNNFGTWANNLTNFMSFTNEFLTDQEVDNQCVALGGCATGIYMYDYIPQSWYQ